MSPLASQRQVNAEQQDLAPLLSARRDAGRGGGGGGGGRSRRLPPRPPPRCGRVAPARPRGARHRSGVRITSGARAARSSHRGASPCRQMHRHLESSSDSAPSPSCSASLASHGVTSASGCAMHGANSVLVVRSNRAHRAESTPTASLQAQTPWRSMKMWRHSMPLPSRHRPVATRFRRPIRYPLPPWALMGARRARAATAAPRRHLRRVGCTRRRPSAPAMVARRRTPAAPPPPAPCSAFCAPRRARSRPICTPRS